MRRSRTLRLAAPPAVARAVPGCRTRMRRDGLAAPCCLNCLGRGRRDTCGAGRSDRFRMRVIAITRLAVGARAHHARGSVHRGACRRTADAFSTREGSRSEPLSLSPRIRGRDRCDAAPICDAYAAAQSGIAGAGESGEDTRRRAGLRLWRRVQFQSGVSDGVWHEPARVPSGISRAIRQARLLSSAARRLSTSVDWPTGWSSRSKSCCPPPLPKRGRRGHLQLIKR
jgi:hypothetical protein